MFGLILALVAPGGAVAHKTSLAYLEISDIDAYYEQVRTRGAQVLKELRDEPWGMREFAVRTADGHRIMFGCPIAPD